MGKIRWVGGSPYWMKPADPDQASFLMALVEESVLETASRKSNASKLSITAAINCTSRLALRVALSSTTLNPRWQPYNFMPGYIKAPASCMGIGVRQLGNTEYIDRLYEVAPELANYGVVESKITGAAYQLDGYIINNNIGFFQPLRQHWNVDYTKILDYQPQEPKTNNINIREAVEQAVRCCGLDNSPFCAELRLSFNGWKIVELHARLGEDILLPGLLSGEYPLTVIERACA